MLLGALLLRPIHDVDIFWQLKLGELVLDHGALVTTEPFAASHLGEPLAQLAWLGQIVLAAVRRIGGWPSLQLFDALLWLGGFCAAGWAVRRSMAAPAGVVAAVMLAFPFALPYSSLRPQSFAVLGFGLLIALLTAQLRWQAKLLLGRGAAGPVAKPPSIRRRGAGLSGGPRGLGLADADGTAA